MIFQVNMNRNYGTITINNAVDAADAMVQAEKQANMFWQGNADNATRKANDVLYAEGEYLVRREPYKAVNAVAQKEVWSAGCGGYVNIPA